METGDNGDIDNVIQLFGEGDVEEENGENDFIEDYYALLDIAVQHFHDENFEECEKERWKLIDCKRKENIRNRFLKMNGLRNTKKELTKEIGHNSKLILLNAEEILRAEALLTEYDQLFNDTIKELQDLKSGFDLCSDIKFKLMSRWRADRLVNLVQGIASFFQIEISDFSLSSLSMEGFLTNLIDLQKKFDKIVGNVKELVLMSKSKLSMDDLGDESDYSTIKKIEEDLFALSSEFEIRFIITHGIDLYKELGVKFEKWLAALDKKE